jgi:hypothetical protein
MMPRLRYVKTQQYFARNSEILGFPKRITPFIANPDSFQIRNFIEIFLNFYNNFFRPSRGALKLNSKDFTNLPIPSEISEIFVRYTISYARTYSSLSRHVWEVGGGGKEAGRQGGREARRQGGWRGRGWDGEAGRTGDGGGEAWRQGEDGRRRRGGRKAGGRRREAGRKGDGGGEAGRQEAARQEARGREAGRQGGREAGRQGGREAGRQEARGMEVGGREAGRETEAGRRQGYQLTRQSVVYQRFGYVR